MTEKEEKVGSPCEDWNCPDKEKCHPKTKWSCWHAYRNWRKGDPTPKKVKC